MNGNHMTSEQNALLKKIQSLSFAKTEAELFLDTHPECRQALEYYKDVCRNHREAMEEYAAKFNPITASGVTGNEWKWAMGEWPWQMGREG